jgi:ubiquinone/menaquinone biosynthesis C-methylase UbiE
MALLLDLDGDVLHSYLLDATSWVREWAPEAARRILDLGAGTGVGTIALAERFGDAEVIAVDSSEPFLARVQAKADTLRLSDRIRTVQADLDLPWPPFDQVDVVWAALSMHHLADPDRALANIHAILHPGGVLAIVEMSSPPRFLPDDIGIGRAGVERRCHAALAQAQAMTMPTLGSDWRPRLEHAGFVLLAARTFTVDPEPPYSASAGRYAHAYLQRILPAVQNRLPDDDLETLRALLALDGPHSLLRRNDLAVHGSRVGWIVRRA